MRQSSDRGTRRSWRVLLSPVVAVVLLAGSASPSAFGQNARERQIELRADASPAKLLLRTGEVDTLHATMSLRDLSRSSKQAPGSRAVIQLEGPMDPTRHQRLVEAGISLEGYLPPNSFIANFDRADDAKLDGLEFVRWQGRYEAEWKLDPEIGLELPGGSESAVLSEKDAAAPTLAEAEAAGILPTWDEAQALYRAMREGG